VIRLDSYRPPQKVEPTIWSRPRTQVTNAETRRIKLQLSQKKNRARGPRLPNRDSPRHAEDGRTQSLRQIMTARQKQRKQDLTQLVNPPLSNNNTVPLAIGSAGTTSSRCLRRVKAVVGKENSGREDNLARVQSQPAEPASGSALGQTLCPPTGGEGKALKCG